MNPEPPPLIIERQRTAGAIAALLDRRLGAGPFGPGGIDPLREALVRIGARYAEILTEHVNAVPERHHEAFVSTLGGEPAPALAARTILTFKPAAARFLADSTIVVPACTPVAAPPAPGESEPVLFETLIDLTVLRLQAMRALAVDPRRMTLADAGDLLLPGGFAAADLLAAAVPIEQALYLSAPAVFGVPHLATLSVMVEVEPGSAPAAGESTQWGIATKDGFVPLAVESDTTGHLQQSGVVVLAPPAAWPVQPVGGAEAMWLVCRRVRTAPGAAAAGTAMPAPARIGRLRIGGAAQGPEQAPAAAAFGMLPLDSSKDFFPFGERPRFGDVFYLSAPAFAQPGALVSLGIRMTNPAGFTTGPLPPVDPAGKPRQKWEIHTARGWVALDVEDGTKGLTRDGEVSFTVPADVLPLAMAGLPQPWVRARLTSGSFGAPLLVDGVSYPAAPSIAALTVRYQVELAPVAPGMILRSGALELTSVDAEATPFFAAFPVPDAAGPILHLALASQELSVQGRTLTLQIEPASPVGRVVWPEGDALPAGDSPRWQCRAAEGWRDCTVIDETAGLTRSGIVQLQWPSAGEPTAWPGSTIDPTGQWLWLRIVWPDSATAPGLRRIALNAVHARQSQRLVNELIGSSNGRRDQVFTALRTPVIGEVRVQVRETEPGVDGLGGNAPSVWVDWAEVADFSASDSHSRHLLVDRRAGRLAFGDGKHGRIPPAGANNIRLAEYHAGGGRRGNLPAGVITQLRTTVPYIDSAVNLERSTGGQDVGDALAVRRAASAWLRHRHRAVCVDDYVDLAREASPEVARAYCYGSRDAAAPRGEGEVAPGIVSLVVVPEGEQPQPQPSLDLLGRVKAYLDERRPLIASLRVLGPAYVPVSVTARIVCVPGRSLHETAAEGRRRLAAFLHPVHGGNDGRGWAPGQRPHRSDLVALLGGVDGVDHVDRLQMQIDESDDDASSNETSLASAGTIEVTG